MSATLAAFASAAMVAAGCSLGFCRLEQNGRARQSGGAAVFLGLAVGLLVAPLAGASASGLALGGTGLLIALLLAPYLLGLHDDWTDSSPRMRLAVLVLLATAAWTVGFRVEHLVLPVHGILALDGFGLPVTVLWIVGITVAFDFIDGMDGLAGGLGLVGCAALLALPGTGPGPWAAAALAGALLGFLLYNLPPARIVLGNGGSNLLGFALALVTIQCCSSPDGGLELVPATFAVVIPIVDAALTLVRRAVLRRGLFRSDLGHLHHRLIRSGRDSRRSLALLVTAAGLCAFGGSLTHAAGRLRTSTLSGASPSPAADADLLLGMGLAVAVVGVAWVLGAAGWLRIARLSELAIGPSVVPAGTEPAPPCSQQAARPG